jgi:hypothetical protein
MLTRLAIFALALVRATGVSGELVREEFLVVGA